MELVLTSQLSLRKSKGRDRRNHQSRHVGAHKSKVLTIGTCLYYTADRSGSSIGRDNGETVAYGANALLFVLRRREIEM